MKKFIALFLVLSMIFCFAACGGDTNEEQSQSEGLPLSGEHYVIAVNAEKQHISSSA